MKNDEFILTPGLILQLERALARNGWKRDEVHTITGGDILGKMRKHMLMPAEPVQTLKGVLDRGPLFQTWKTITIGQRKSVDEIIQALSDGECNVIPEALTLLRHPSVVLAKEPTQVNLALLHIEDFGLEEYLHYSLMCRRIKRMGFELCTPEMAAELRLVFDEQDIAAVIAMKPIDDEVLELYVDEDKGLLELYAQDVSEYSNYARNCLDYVCVIP